MFLEPSQKNRYTVGKVFRKLKGLRKADTTAKIVAMPPQLQEYVDELYKKGLQVKNLKFAMFETKNGLSYPGLVATDPIDSNTVLVKVPTNQLLTTRQAFLSDIQKVFVQNPGFYAKRFTGQWEDRILLTYILYEYQKGEKSRWYNLIRNLPRDIDYAIFWNQSEIKELEDQFFHLHIVSQKEKFDKQCEQLIKILNNYPEFFHKQTINQSNIHWIHTHLITRCFGKYFQYTTMVPFAELFNHQCTDVYYTMYYKPGNPNDQGEEFYPEKCLTEKQMDQCQSSDGSYEADDFSEDDNCIDSLGDTVDLDRTVYGQDVLKDIKSIRIHMFTFLNFSDSVSKHYLSCILQVLLKTSEIQSWDQRKQKCEQIHSTNIKYIKKVKQFYNKINKKYYNYGIRQKRKDEKKDKVIDKPVKGEKYFQQSWSVDKFDQFYMLCSTKDQFEKGAQVFFCYGRLPNKLLLMRYGFALEHNKYDHMFLKINISEQVLKDPFLRTVLPEIEIKKYIKFKVKRTKMCRELLTYIRGQFWKFGDSVEDIFSIRYLERETKVLEGTKQIYLQRLNKYSKSLKQNQEELCNRQLGYHSHFALIYRVEQQRILHEQIKMLEYAKQVFGKIKEGVTLKEILLKEDKAENLTRQIMMEAYFKSFNVQ